MRKSFFILWMMILVCSSLFAQDNTDTYADEEDISDSTGLSSQVTGDTLLAFRDITDAADTVGSWKRSKDFAYIKNLDSLLDAYQKQPPKEGSSISSGHRGSNAGLPSTGILPVILWCIAGFFVCFILYQLFLSNGVFKKAAAKRISETGETETENISDTDYEKLLRQAYLLGDMRRAARYLFLKTLQKLDRKELIVFAADKTNMDYLYEMPAAKRNDFSSLALYYEYIWYGNLPVKKADFDRIEIRYNNFLNGL